MLWKKFKNLILFFETFSDFKRMTKTLRLPNMWTLIFWHFKRISFYFTTTKPNDTIYAESSKCIQMKMSFSIPANFFLFYVIINSCQISLHNGSENNFQSGTFLRFKVTTIVIVMKYQTICSFHTSAWLKLIENRRGLNKFQHNLSDLETIKNFKFF